MINTTVQVEGVKATLKALKEIDPALRRAAIKEMKSAAQPMVNEVRSRMPLKPLDNWGEGGRLGWDVNKARRSVKLRFGGKKIRGGSGNQYPLLRLVIQSPAATMYDMAGKRGQGKTPQGQVFVRVLTADWGRPSRLAWPAAEKHMDSVQRGVIEAIDKAAAEINREIKRVN